MGRVQINAQGLRALRDHSLQVGTLEKWSEVALEWAEQAEACLEEPSESPVEIPGGGDIVDMLYQLGDAWDERDTQVLTANLVRSAANEIRRLRSQPSAGREVSEEEFERAVLASYKAPLYNRGYRWEDLSAGVQNLWRDTTRVALESLGITISPAPESE